MQGIFTNEMHAIWFYMHFIIKKKLESKYLEDGGTV